MAYITALHQEEEKDTKVHRQEDRRGTVKGLHHVDHKVTDKGLLHVMVLEDHHPAGLEMVIDKDRHHAVIAPKERETVLNVQNGKLNSPSLLSRANKSGLNRSRNTHLPTSLVSAGTDRHLSSGEKSLGLFLCALLIILSMNATLRKYESTDLEAVLSSWENATRIAHPFFTEEFLDQERHNIPEMYLPNAETWVAENAQSVVGFFALIGNEVGAIFVDPDFQGQGIGTLLIDKACELRGDLEVEVFAENRVGRPFYEKYGFVPLSESIHEATGKKLLRLQYRSSKD